MSRMDKIIQFREADSDITVQSGLGWEAINEYLEDQGVKLFFPVSSPTPSSNDGCWH